jgi:hypothetical protein
MVIFLNWQRWLESGDEAIFELARPAPRRAGRHARTSFSETHVVVQDISRMARREVQGGPSTAAAFSLAAYLLHPSFDSPFNPRRTR